MNVHGHHRVERKVKRPVANLSLLFLLALAASGQTSVSADTDGTNADKPMPPPPATAPAPVPPANPPLNQQIPLHFTGHAYPWHNGILTTIFWIGNNLPDWSSPGGSMPFDPNGPAEVSSATGYGPAGGVLKINPFYVALPFNDLKFPDLARQWMPVGWNPRPKSNGEPVSACQGRWIEMKSASGRICFAQWEDVGPLWTDDAAYVFGSESPRQGKSGLDVSPAVAKYLGMDGHALLSWRFVDDKDVLPGVWLRYDEQQILYQAIRDQQKGK
jgi:hypothetical protein